MIRLLKTKKTFEPFLVGIEINSLEDAKAIYAIFNNVPIVNFLSENSGISDDNMRDVLLEGNKHAGDANEFDSKLDICLRRFFVKSANKLVVREKL